MSIQRSPVQTLVRRAQTNQEQKSTLQDFNLNLFSPTINPRGDENDPEKTILEPWTKYSTNKYRGALSVRYKA